MAKTQKISKCKRNKKTTIVLGKNGLNAKSRRIA